MLGWLKWRWLGGIYSPQPPNNRWGWAPVDGRTRKSGAPATSPNHLGLTVGALSSNGTGQTLFTVWCAYSGCSDFCTHCSCNVALQASVVVDRCAGSRCSAWCTGQSGGTSDSLVNYSGARPQKPECEEFEGVRSWCTGHCPVAHRTARCARPGHTWVSLLLSF
jgi:hypothetical protein